MTRNINESVVVGTNALMSVTGTAGMNSGEEEEASSREIDGNIFGSRVRLNGEIVCDRGGVEWRLSSRVLATSVALEICGVARQGRRATS
jgi:hypothetical protein